MKSLPLALAPTFFFALAPASLAQYERAWTFGYDAPSTTDLRMGGLAATPDGGFIATQSTFIPSQGIGEPQAAIVKFSANGDRAWEVLLEGPGTGSNSNFRRIDTAVNDSGQVFVGISSFFEAARVASYSADGTLLWSTFLPGAQGVGAVEVLPGGDVVAAGFFYQGLLYPYVRLTRIDPSGQVVWESETVQMFTSEIQVSPTGRIAAVGPEDWLEDYQWGILAVFEDDGTLAWSNRVAAAGQVLPNGLSGWYEEIDAVTFGASGAVYSATFGVDWTPNGTVPGFALYACSPAGSVTGHTVTSGSGAAYPEAIAVDEAEDVVYVAGWDADCETCTRHAALFAFDLAGNPRWTRRIGPGGMGNGRALAIRTLGEDRVIVSSLVEGGTTGSDVGLYTVFDSAGQTLWSRADAGTFQEDLRFEFGSIVADERQNLFVQHHRGEGVFFQKLVPGAAVGQSVCGPAAANSTGLPGQIAAIGTDIAVDDNLVLTMTDFPPNTFAMVIASRTAGFLPGVGGGQGNLCLANSIGRYDRMEELRRVRLDGTSSFQLDVTRLRESTGPAVGLAGQDWYFQAWYRDANPSVTSNLTNAVQVTLR